MRKIEDKIQSILDFLGVVTSVLCLIKAAVEGDSGAIFGWLAAVIWATNCLIKDLV